MQMQHSSTRLNRRRGRSSFDATGRGEGATKAWPCQTICEACRVPSAGQCHGKRHTGRRRRRHIPNPPPRTAPDKGRLPPSCHTSNAMPTPVAITMKRKERKRPFSGEAFFISGGLPSPNPRITQGTKYQQMMGILLK